MNKFMISLVLAMCVVFAVSMAFGNPGMLPSHPGYPMSAAKSPVTGQPVANDPGQAPPSVDESLKQASAFHDAHAMSPQKEVRPNVVYEHEKMKEQVIKK
jgi:hypothetical protein